MIILCFSWCDELGNGGEVIVGATLVVVVAGREGWVVFVFVGDPTRGGSEAGVVREDARGGGGGAGVESAEAGRLDERSRGGGSFLERGKRVGFPSALRDQLRRIQRRSTWRSGHRRAVETKPAISHFLPPSYAASPIALSYLARDRLRQTATDCDRP